MTKLSIKNKLRPTNNCVAVVMAGGSGTRFWPLSRSGRPKQYLPLGDKGKSLLKESLDRLIPLIGENASLIVTASNQVDLARRHAVDTVIIPEAIARNTAACLGLAAHIVLKVLGDIPMISTPADHLIKDDKELLNVFNKACTLAETEDVLVTIGIKPTYPETGYGYIKRGDVYKGNNNKLSGAFSVKQFVEKPDKETASTYVESGSFYWNSGMFVWRPSVLIQEIAKYLPLVNSITEQCADILIEEDLNLSEESSKKLLELYSSLESVSIDQGILEEAENVVVFPGYGFQWSDVGSWSSWTDSVADSLADGYGNVFLSDVLSISSKGCSVITEQDFFAKEHDVEKSDGTVRSSKTIALVGMEDVIVVDTGDCLLICKKEESQKVKQIVDLLREKKKVHLI